MTSSKRLGSLANGTLSVCVAALTLSCGGASTKAPATPPSAKPAPVETPPPAKELAPKEEELAFMATGKASTEAEAYSLAKQRLLVALLDSESLQKKEDAFGQALAVVVHLRDGDSYTKISTAEGFEVRIGLRAEGVAPAFLRLDAALPTVALPALPPALQRAVRKLRESSLQQRLCQRQEELTQKECCSASNPAQAEQELRALLRGIDLQPAYEGGLPTSDGAFLRPLRVFARLREPNEEIPLAGLPLSVQLEGQQELKHFKTDERGMIEALPAEGTALDARFAITVELPALVGVELPSFQLASLQVQGRPTGLSRSALLALERDQLATITLNSLEQGLNGKVTKKVALLQEDQDSLRHSASKSRQQLLPKLADKYQGRLDTLLVLDAESEFASRMGTHRVWFEARGKLTAVNVWTGKTIQEVTASVTESGVGESRAEKAARKALGSALAAKLQSALEEKTKSAAVAKLRGH